MTGPAEHAAVLQAASVLLQYPDEQVRSRIPAVRSLLASLPDGVPVAALRRLAAEVDAADPALLQEQYVETLDRRRKCCLYLTWWTHGETRRRGLALARLKAVYRAAGVELEPGELPDFLPVVLEFAATVDLGQGLGLLQEHRAGLELLRLALVDVGSPYAAALEAVCALLPGASPSDEREARALARSGPPTETVGIDGLPGYAGGAVPGASDGFDSFVPLESVGVRR